MPPSFTNEVPRIAPLLSANGYTTILSDPGSIGSLKTVSGDGVFYMSSHGGACTVPDIDPATGNVRVNPDGTAIGRAEFGIWTSSPYNPNDPNEFRDDMRLGRVGVGIDTYDRRTGEERAHYWITWYFVNAYMNFGQNSLVWFSACHSNSGYSTSLVAQCLLKGAGLYVGWSDVVGTKACVAAGRFIFDRLLGSNTTNPKENPPQRPFDYEGTWADLRFHGLHLHPIGGSSPPATTEIKYQARAGGTDFGLLAPSIERVLISETTDQAILKGIFGSPPANERAVMIGGIEAMVDSWAEDEILCRLPRTGAGSAGDVFVMVRAHKSNVRRITEWNIPMDFEFRDPDRPILKVSGPIFVRFRADVGEYREIPHDPPERLPVRAAIATRESSADFTGTGTWADDDGECVYTWEGHETFPASGYGTLFPPFLLARFKVDPITKKGAIGLALAAFLPPFTIKSVCGGSAAEQAFVVGLGELYGEDTFPDPLERPAFPDVPIFAIERDFGPNYEIPAGVVEDLSTGVMRLEWDAVTPNFPPDPDAARAPLAVAEALP
jgi:hypothetical protein